MKKYLAKSNIPSRLYNRPLKFSIFGSILNRRHRLVGMHENLYFFWFLRRIWGIGTSFILRAQTILLILIVVSALLIRFYNFSNRVTFWSEQARSLMVSAGYVYDKFSLLGQEYFRQDSNHHTIFSGALFNYTLVPLLFLFDFDPIKITATFALLNVATGLVLYFGIGKYVPKTVALISLFLFLFSPLMIYHSLFIWNYNFLPLVFLMMLLISLNKNLANIPKMFWIGLVGGIGISLQILFLPITLILLLTNLKLYKKQPFVLVYFFAGLLMGNLPMVIFDVRHNFYNTKTILQYALDTIRGKSDAGFAYYYFLPFWPVLVVVLAKIIHFLGKISFIFPVVLLVIFFIAGQRTTPIYFDRPNGNPYELTVKDFDKVSKIISEKSGTRFNVVSVLDFDKRAYVLRYFLEFKYGKRPMGITQYDNIDELFVLAPTDYNFAVSNVWEIAAAGIKNTENMGELKNGTSVFRMYRNEN